MAIYEIIQNYKQTHFPLKRTCVASSSYWHWSFKLHLLSSLKHDGWWFAKGHPKWNRNDLFNRYNTSNRSPKHTRRFKTNYSHMVLVILHMIVILYYITWTLECPKEDIPVLFLRLSQQVLATERNCEILHFFVEKLSNFFVKIPGRPWSGQCR